MTKMYLIVILVTMFSALCLVSCAPARGNVYPLSAKYLHFDKLHEELMQIAALHPDLGQLRIIGFSSTENLPIYALEIGNPTAQQQVLIIGQHHGDEVLGVNVSVQFARQLLADPAEVSNRKILQNYRFWIVPTINPEGFRIVSSGTYPHKRKTNRDTDGNKKLDLRTDGVDLNRNYPVFWDLDPETNIQSPYYKGSEPASEKEVQAVIALAQQQEFDTALFYHSSATGAYSEMIFLPSRGADSPLYKATLEMAQNYAGMVKRDYHRGNYIVHTRTTSDVGNARNYFFHRRGCKAFLVEIGGINREGVSVIHPDDAMLSKIVNKHLKALTMLFSQAPKI